MNVYQIVAVRVTWHSGANPFIREEPVRAAVAARNIEEALERIKRTFYLHFCGEPGTGFNLELRDVEFLETPLPDLLWYSWPQLVPGGNLNVVWDYLNTSSMVSAARQDIRQRKPSEPSQAIKQRRLE